jgi:hypothetical protein
MHRCRITSRNSFLVSSTLPLETTDGLDNAEISVGAIGTLDHGCSWAGNA